MTHSPRFLRCSSSSARLITEPVALKSVPSCSILTNKIQNRSSITRASLIGSGLRFCPPLATSSYHVSRVSGGRCVYVHNAGNLFGGSKNVCPPFPCIVLEPNRSASAKSSRSVWVLVWTVWQILVQARNTTTLAQGDLSCGRAVFNFLERRELNEQDFRELPPCTHKAWHVSFWFVPTPRFSPAGTVPPGARFEIGRELVLPRITPRWSFARASPEITIPYRFL